jgi:hypothetical protein
MRNHDDAEQPAEQQTALQAPPVDDLLYPPVAEAPVTNPCQ